VTDMISALVILSYKQFDLTLKEFLFGSAPKEKLCYVLKEVI